MIRRRATFDPLEPTREPRWLVVRNMHGALLEARSLSPGSDLKRAFVALMLEWIDAGWQLGEFSSTTGTFRAGLGFSDRSLSGGTAIFSANRRSSTDETTQTQPLTGLQGPSGFGRHQGREDAGAAGGAL